MSDHYTQSFNWISRPNFVRAINNARLENKVEFLTFHDIPHDEFLRLSKWADRSDQTNPRFKVFAYEADVKRLVVRISFNPHEGLISGFTLALSTLDGMRDLIFTTLTMGGASRARTSDGRIQAEPFNCLFPRSRLHGQGGSSNVFPSLVIEVGRSQQVHSLQQKARLWFRMSEGAVKIVLLIKTSEESRIITVEKWMLVEDLQGPMTRSRAARQFEPECVQAIRIEPMPGLDLQGQQDWTPPDFNVVAPINSRPLPMVLEFSLVCDRQPVPPDESDIHLDVRFFQTFMTASWPSLSCRYPLGF